MQVPACNRQVYCLVNTLYLPAQLLNMRQLYFLSSGDTFPFSYTPVSDSRFRNAALLLIFLGSLFRLFWAFRLELGNDEAYYWLYSQYLQWNYIDHPPMVAIWIRLFTGNGLFSDMEGFLRLGSIAGCACSSWFMYKTGALLHSSRAGWYSVLLYQSSFYAAVTAGLYILPDTPQMVFWTASLLMIARITTTSDAWSSWVLFGLASGLCIMSKMHGVFLWMGVGSYALLKERSWLKKPQLYVALLLTMVIASPVFFWNLQNHFISFQSHSYRLSLKLSGLNATGFGKQLLSQVFFNNPVNFILILMALLATRKKKNGKGQFAQHIYIIIGLSLAILLLFLSFFMEITMPHWSGPAYVSLVPICAIWLAGRETNFFPMVLRWSIGLSIISVSILFLAILFFPGTYGNKKAETLGKGDMTLDMFGWKAASQAFSLIYQQDLRKGIMAEKPAMVTSRWWGTQVDYYFCRPLGLPMLGLGSSRQVGQYLWTNLQRKKMADKDAAYCIIPSDDGNRVPSEYFRAIEKAATITVFRSGKPARIFFVYRMKGWKKEVPVAR